MDPALIVQLVILIIKVLLLIFDSPERVMRVLKRRNRRHPVIETLLDNPYILGRSLTSSQKGVLTEVLARLKLEDVYAIQDGTFREKIMQGIHPATASENAKRILEAFLQLTDEQIDEQYPAPEAVPEGQFGAPVAKAPPNKDQVKAISFAASMTLSSIANATGNGRFIAFAQFVSAMTMNPETFEQIWNIVYPPAPTV